MSSRYAMRQWEKTMEYFRYYKTLAEGDIYPLLRDADPLKRHAAAMNMQLRGFGLSVAKAMCRATDYKTRDLGCFILGQIRTEEKQLPTIMAQLDALAVSDPTATVRGSAISAMGHRYALDAAGRFLEVGRADIWSILANRCRLAAAEPFVTVRISVAGALAHGHHLDDSLLPTLIQLLQDRQGEVRSWAGCAVNGNGYNTPELHPIFAAMLTDEHEGARDEAEVWWEENGMQEEINHDLVRRPRGV